MEERKKKNYDYNKEQTWMKMNRKQILQGKEQKKRKKKKQIQTNVHM